MKTKKIVISLALIFSIFAACSDSGTVKNDPCAGADAQSNPECNVAPICGDGACATSENFENCPKDCVNTNVSACGNDICESGETVTSCPDDCKAATSCGDGTCSAPDETSSTCPADCKTTNPVKPVCGDNSCETGETTETCPADCSKVAEEVCGNGLCEAGEAVSNCPEDCSSPSVCGDAKCEQAENYGNCPSDCEKPVICGDATCDAGETNETCAADCPKLPDTFIGNIKARISEFLTVDKTPVVEQVTREKITLPCLITATKWNEAAFADKTAGKINDLEIFNGKLYVARDDGLFAGALPSNSTQSICVSLIKDETLPIETPIEALTTSNFSSVLNQLTVLGKTTNTYGIATLDTNGSWQKIHAAPSLSGLDVEDISMSENFVGMTYVAYDKVLLKLDTNNGVWSWKEVFKITDGSKFKAIKSVQIGSSQQLYALLTNNEFGYFNFLGKFTNIKKDLNLPEILKNGTDIDAIVDADNTANLLFASSDGIYLFETHHFRLLDNPKGNFKKIFVDATDKLAFALTNDGKIYVSKDFGVTWSQIERGSSPSGISAIVYKDGFLFGATSGENGKVFVTKIN